MKRVLVVAFIGVVVWLSGSLPCNPQPSSAVPENIERLLKEGNFNEARIEIEKFRRKSPDNARAIFYLARLEKDTNKAIALLKEAEILADPSLAAEAVLARAEISFIGNSLAVSEELYDRIVTKYPATPSCKEAHYYLGLIMLVDGQPDDAQAHFKQCLESAPDRSLKTLALAGIMECLYAQKEWEAVIESARTVLEQDTDNTLTPRVLEVSSYSWRELGNEENANRYIERLLKNFPESYQAHAFRVNASRIAGDAGLLIDSQSAGIDSLAAEIDSDSNKEGVSAEVEENTDAESADFTVQASAFMDKTNALKMFTRLKENGFDAHLSMKSIADKQFYIVQVGTFKTREEAEKIVTRVTTFTGIKAHVINKK